jgi:REP element-mobilizing transposase RayT
MPKNQIKYDPAVHQRRSIRLKRHDYAGGGEYFVTLCAHQEFIAAHGRCPFDPFREIIQSEWLRCGEVRDDVFPGEYAIMPDHFHGLIRIESGQSELGKVVGAFKAAVSRKIRTAGGATCVSPVRCRGDSQIASGSQIRIWLRNYYERIIRGTEDRERTARYIQMNPVKLQFCLDGIAAMGNPVLWERPTLGILASGGTGDTHVALPRPRLPKETVLFSGCHSGMEQALASESRRPLIWMPAICPDSVGFSPWQLKKMEEGNLLVLCPFKETHTTRANALSRNRLIAERCDRLWILAARKGGSLEPLKKEYYDKLIP